MVLESKKKANRKWDKDNMTVLGCKVRKSDAERYKAAAAAQGTTINAVLKAALDELTAGDPRKEQNN